LLVPGDQFLEDAEVLGEVGLESCEIPLFLGPFAMAFPAGVDAECEQDLADDHDRLDQNWGPGDPLERRFHTGIAGGLSPASRPA
jgi:hypothetical protein